MHQGKLSYSDVNQGKLSYSCNIYIYIYIRYIIIIIIINMIRSQDILLDNKSVMIYYNMI